MRSERAHDVSSWAGTALAVALACMFGSVGCTGNLFTPEETPEPVIEEEIRMVQPYLRLEGPDVTSTESVWVDVHPSHYLSGTRDSWFTFSPPLTRFRETTAAPFLLELERRNPAQTILLTDVYPAVGETIVVRWPEPNLLIHMEWPDWIIDSDVVQARAATRMRLSRRSEHVENSTGSWGSLNLYQEARDGRILRAYVPAAADSLESVDLSWSTTETDSTSVLRYQTSAGAFSLSATTEITIAANFVRMPLRLTWGGGAFVLDEFDFSISNRTPGSRAESVDASYRRTRPATPTVGFVGESDLRVIPVNLEGVLPWAGSLEWDGAGEVAIELGRYEFELRVVDGAGRPRPFTEVRLQYPGPPTQSAVQTTDREGRVRWYVNEGDFSARLDDDPSDVPWGGPWRVDADRSVTWVVP